MSPFPSPATTGDSSWGLFHTIEFALGLMFLAVLASAAGQILIVYCIVSASRRSPTVAPSPTNELEMLPA
ncbi:hypothetical protein MtrunA17_Chr5g0444761 [Medicago truncatula]|uniref:Transmembrane protein, putative n=1 Tax=Medicago truncatula TaxID=3880 RepID=G7K8N6_MEDTR|nr:transmembrane protein, putative [Medicago truncatula]RHN57841.1 hypothetical protein MtrunA17_Chr5g0444761 [Medicago truncatula]